MRAGTQLLGSYALLLALQVLTSLVAIALFTRMSPAIEHILEENVASVAAVEDMLALLGRATVLSVEEREAYHAALRRAEESATEEDERPAIETLGRLAEPALAGDPAARTESVRALLELGRVNREAMVRADDEAKRLGAAGGWAAALLGLVGLGASFIAIGRARRRYVAPVAEIERTVRAHRAGELHKRAVVTAESAPELAAVSRFLNELLDQRERSVPDTLSQSSVDRSVALHLLDRLQEPVAVVDSAGELVVANRAAEELLAGPAGTRRREALWQARKEPDRLPSGVSRRETLGETGATMLVLAPGE